MCAEPIEGHVVRMALSGTSAGISILEKMLDCAEEVSHYQIDENNVLTVYLDSDSEQVLARAFITAGIYPVGVFDATGEGGPSVC